MRAVEMDYLGSRLLLLGSIRGLVAEAAAVKAEFLRFAPLAVALPVGPREIDEIEQTLKEKDEPRRGTEGEPTRPTGPTGLKDEKIEKSEDDNDFEDFGLFVSGSDMVFLRKLSRYGDVEMPPPSYQEALHLGRSKGIPALGVDLDDEAYTDAFIANISLIAMWRQGNKLRRMTKRKFKAADAESFALEWDALETKIAGYRRLQRAREEKIAAGIAAAAKDHERLLAVVEVERMDGVVRALNAIAGARSRAPQAEAAPSPP